MRKSIYSILFVIMTALPVLAQSVENRDAEYLQLTKEYTLNRDGSISYHHSHQLKILSHFAFHRLFGESFIVYNPQMQKLKIHKAETTMADGKVVPSPENAFNKVLPRFAVDAPAYNKFREMVVTHTGLEVGATIALDYTLSSKADYFPALMGEELVLADAPAKEMNIIIRVPKGQTLNHRMIGLRTAPEITHEKGMDVYHWTFRPVKARSHERYQPESHIDAPRLVFSTARDQQWILNKLVAQKAFSQQPVAAMMPQVKTLIKDMETPLEKALAIQKWVVKDVKYYPIPLHYLGFKSRTPVQCFTSNGGTLLEKTLLMTNMMQAAGIDARAVAVMPSFLSSPDMGNLNLINNLLVKVNHGKGEYVFLSAKHLKKQSAEFEQTDRVFIVLDPYLETYRAKEFARSVSKIACEGEFILDAEKKLAGELDVKFTDAVNPYFTLVEADACIAKSLLGFGKDDVKAATQKDLDKSQSHYVLTLEKEKALGEYAGELLAWELPKAVKGVDSWHMTVLYENRKSPLVLPNQLEEKYKFTLEIPKGMQLATPPTDLHLENAAGKLDITIQAKGQKVTVKKSIVFHSPIVLENQYKFFKELMLTWQNDKYSKILFK